MSASAIRTLLVYLVLCVTAAWIPIFSQAPAYDPSSEEFPGWDASPIPSQLSPVAPGPREARFAENFPGRIGVFTDGQRTYIVRWVRTATRKLHPASDCLRALGYSLQPGKIFAGADGSHWGSCVAKKEPGRLRVRERIVDSVGREWTDVSAWYWYAAFGQSCGPWWAVTILESETTTAAKSGLP